MVRDSGRHIARGGRGGGEETCWPASAQWSGQITTRVHSAVAARRRRPSGVCFVVIDVLISSDREMFAPALPQRRGRRGAVKLSGMVSGGGRSVPRRARRRPVQARCDARAHVRRVPRRLHGIQRRRARVPSRQRGSCRASAPPGAHVGFAMIRLQLGASGVARVNAARSLTLVLVPMAGSSSGRDGWRASFLACYGAAGLVRCQRWGCQDGEATGWHRTARAPARMRLAWVLAERRIH